jgi:DNA-binding transcriptional MerR regulator
MFVSESLSIGALAERAGCNVPTIRYYEQVGLLPRASRREGGHRTYRDADLRRLVFIRRCRDFGFPIEQVRELVELAENPRRDCAATRGMTQLHLDAVRAKLKDLKALERNLVHFVERCTAACLGGPAPDCLILDEIAAPRARGNSASKRCCG